MRAKEAAGGAHKEEQRQQIEEKVALQEQDELYSIILCNTFWTAFNVVINNPVINHVAYSCATKK